MLNKVLIQGEIRYNKNVISKYGNIHIYAIEQVEKLPSGKEYTHSFLVKLFGQKSNKTFENGKFIEVKGSLSSESYQKEGGEWVRNTVVRAEEIKEIDNPF